MVYKPTCNWGAPSCDDSWDFWGPTLLVTKKLGVEMVWARRHLCCWFGFRIQNNFTWNLCSCFFGANCVQVLQFHCSMSFSKLVYRSLRRTYLTSGYPHTHTQWQFSKGKWLSQPWHLVFAPTFSDKRYSWYYGDSGCGFVMFCLQNRIYRIPSKSTGKSIIITLQ